MTTEPPSDPAGPGQDDDPLAWLTLDENFIKAAQRAEPSAKERERAARQENLRRLLADEDAQKANAAHAQRRSALGDPVKAGRRRRKGTPRGDRSDRSDRLVGMAKKGIVAAVVIVVVGAAVVQARQGGDVVAASSNGELIARPDDWPPLVKDPSPTPLGTPPTITDPSDSHKFLEFQPHGVTPVAYDPCRPIHYVTRPGGPVEGDQLIREAVAKVSAATGLVFVDDGATDEAPSDDREPYQPDRYPGRWAPVLIAWSDPVESPMLGEVDPDAPDTDVAGFAGSQQVSLSTEETTMDSVYVTGSVTLDGPDATEMLGWPDGWESARAIIEHELGHLVGLDHVADTTQLMNPEGQTGLYDYGAGDLTGLAALGAGACFPEI